MKIIKLFSALTILYITACATSQIYTDKDDSVNLSAYRSFAWYPTPNEELQNSAFNNQIIEGNVKTAATKALTLKGYRPDIDTPDLVFEYHIMVEKKVQQEQQPVYSSPYNYRYYGSYDPYWRGPVYNGVYTNAPYIVGYKTVDIPYEEGTFTINAIDRKTNRLVWRGWAIGTLTDPEQYEDDLKKSIERIFKKFPSQQFFIPPQKAAK